MIFISLTSIIKIYSTFLITVSFFKPGNKQFAP